MIVTQDLVCNSIFSLHLGRGVVSSVRILSLVRMVSLVRMENGSLVRMENGKFSQNGMSGQKGKKCI